MIHDRLPAASPANPPDDGPHDPLFLSPVSWPVSLPVSLATLRDLVRDLLRENERLHHEREQADRREALLHVQLDQLRRNNVATLGEVAALRSIIEGAAAEARRQATP